MCVCVYLHTLHIDELALLLVPFSVEELPKVFDLVGQLMVQIKLHWELRDPVPERGSEREGEEERGSVSK